MSADLPVRISPRDPADWDETVYDALSVLRPPSNTAAPVEEPAPAPAAEPAPRPVSNIVGIFACHPALAKGFFTFNNHLFRSTLTARVRELVTTRVGWLRKGEYEWAQHVKMARAAGMSAEEVDAISVGPESSVWGPVDATTLRAVDELIADRYISDETWKLLEQSFNRQELMDIVFTVGAYDVLAMAMNTFGLQLDPGLDGFPADAKWD